MQQHLTGSNGLDLKGAPSTTVFNISAPVSLFKIKSGVGLMVESDNIGFDKDINLSAVIFISYGSWHWENWVSELTWECLIKLLIPPGRYLPVMDLHQPDQDPLIPENKESFVAFDAGLGSLSTKLINIMQHFQLLI